MPLLSSHPGPSFHLPRPARGADSRSFGPVQRAALPRRLDEGAVVLSPTEEGERGTSFLGRVVCPSPESPKGETGTVWAEVNMDGEATAKS